MFWRHYLDFPGLANMHSRKRMKRAMMIKQKFIMLCMAVLAFTLIVMSWHAPVNSDMSETMESINAQGSGNMISTSTLVDWSYVYAARGAKGYYTLSGNSCDIEMNVYIYSSQDYSRYNAGQNVTPYRTFRMYPSRRWSFIAPASDTWYFVYKPATMFSGSINVYINVQADNSGPIISTNLQNFLDINSSFTIQANATDLFQVSYIGIQINSVLKAYVYKTTTISYTWTPDPNFQQMNTVTIVAQNQFGQVSQCSYSIIGADRTCPVVTWNNVPSTVSGSYVTLSISLSDNIALKRLVVLMNGRQLYDKEYSSSYYYSTSDIANFNWNSLALGNGYVTLTAIAWDLKGLNKTSSITVFVDNNGNSGSSTPTTSSNNAATAGGIVAIFAVFLFISVIAAIVAKANKKNATNTGISFSASSATSHASRPVIQVHSTISSRPSTSSSTTSSHPSTSAPTSSRPSTMSSTSRRPASPPLVRSILPASCFVPNTQWEVVEGIRTRPSIPVGAQNAIPTAEKTIDMVTPEFNHVIAPKVSRMYTDGADTNPIATWNHATSSSIQASMPMLFCKTCNAPVVPDQGNSSNPATCKNCGSVLMQLVPIASITRAKFVHADADYKAFVDVLSWMLAKQAIPSGGSLNKARLNIILNHTGHADIDLRRFIDKMLRTRLFAAETETTVVLARTIVEYTSLGSILTYLSEYLRSM